MITEIDGRKVMFENNRCRAVGLIMTCNNCDRIIFEDENWSVDDYRDNAGYCRECAGETDNQTENKEKNGSTTT